MFSCGWNGKPISRLAREYVPEYPPLHVEWIRPSRCSRLARESEYQHIVPEVAPAAIKVLHTPELLEKILINITDLKTLLFAQQVDKFWSELITSSPSLQKKLFFRAATLDELFSLSIVTRRDSREDFKAWYSLCGSGDGVGPETGSRIVDFSGRGSRRVPSNKLAVVNTLICSDDWSSTKVVFPPSQQHDNLRQAIKPSWMRMLVSQPPVPSIMIRVIPAIYADEWVSYSIQEGTGQQTMTAFEASQADHFMNLEDCDISIGDQAGYWDLEDSLDREESVWPEAFDYDASSAADTDDQDDEHETRLLAVERLMSINHGTDPDEHRW